MGHMVNGDMGNVDRDNGYRGMGYRRWSTWAMGHMDYESTRCNGVQGYGAHTWAMGYRGIGYRRYGLQAVWGT